MDKKDVLKSITDNFAYAELDCLDLGNNEITVTMPYSIINLKNVYRYCHNVLNQVAMNSLLDSDVVLAIEVPTQVLTIVFKLDLS